MLPTFGEAEIVTCEIISFSDLKAGDTVIRWHELTHEYIHHRIEYWDVTTGAWFTKGDNNLFPDRSRMFQVDFVAKTRKFQP
jgi:hypothetical protein